MSKRFDFKSILLGIMFIAFTTTASIAAIGGGLPLYNGDLTSQEQEEFDSENLSHNEYISIYSGETKLISFPRKVDTISFSKDSGFSIRTLIGGVWKDMSDNPKDYEVMQGYIVRNFGNQTVNIHVEYAPISTADQALYQKELKAGWNLYAPAVKNDYCSAVKANDALQGSNYSQIIDFSDMGFKKHYSAEVSVDHVYSGETLVINKYNAHPQNFREDGNYVIKNNTQAAEDFIYEGSAYGVFVNNDTLVSGNQNITDGVGNELIKYNSHPLVVFKNNVNTQLDVTNNDQIELLNFDLTSKYAGNDQKGTSSILASLSVVGYDGKGLKLTDVFENITLKIDGIETAFTTTQCRIDDKIEKCNNGNMYLHLVEPKLLTRGLDTNFTLLANAKNDIQSNYQIKLDLSNTLILDDKNLLPYCKYEGYILGDKSYNSRKVNIDTSSYTAVELAAAENLAAKGIINVASNPKDYGFNLDIERAVLAKLNAGVAGLYPNVTCQNKFADVSATSPNTWLCGYVEALLDNGLIDANTNYNPLMIATKAEVVKNVLKASGKEVPHTPETWKQDYVNYAVENGFITNFSDYDSLADRGFYYVITDAVLSSTDDGDDDILGDLDCLLGGICGIPWPPKGFTGSYNSGNIDLSWDTLSGATKYEIGYTHDKMTELEQLLLTIEEASSNSYTLAGLVTDANYTIKVRGVDAQGEKGRFTQVIVVNTTEDDLGGDTNTGTTLPSPTGLSGEYSSGTINLNWDVLSGAMKYEVGYTHDKMSELEKIFLLTKESVANNYTFTGVVAGANYNISVRGIDVEGEPGSFSQEIVINVPNNGNDNNDLGVVTNVTLTDSSTGSLNISWDEALNASGYAVKLGETEPMSIDSNLYNQFLEGPGMPTTETSMLLDGLNVGTQYTVIIAAYTGDRETISEEFTFTTDDLGVVTNVRLTDSSTGSLNISWDEALNASGYAVKLGETEPMSIDSNLYNQFLEGPGMPTTETSMLLDGLNVGTQYTVIIAAYTGDRETISEEFTFTTDDLGVVTNVRLTDSSTGSLNISWDEALNASGYAVKLGETEPMSIDSNLYNQFLEGPGMPTTETSMLLDGLNVGTQYTVIIAAYTGDRETISEEFTFTTDDLGVVTNVRLTDSSTGSLNISWDEALNASGYAVKLGETEPMSIDSNLYNQFLEGPGMPTTETSMLLDGLNVGTQYTVIIAAYTGDRETISEEFTFTTDDLGVVTNVRLTDSSTGSLNISWDEALNASGYAVKLGETEPMSIDSNLYNQFLEGPGMPTTETSMLLDGLNVGTQYTVIIAAYTGDRETISEEFIFTTDEIK